MNRLLCAPAPLLGLAPLAFAQDTLRVGDVSASRGTKVTGAIHLQDGARRLRGPRQG